jgi:hypothetical protein
MKILEVAKRELRGKGVPKRELGNEIEKTLLVQPRLEMGSYDR